MAAADKDTIYIDIDDEITGIIDKVRASNGKVVALVLPKRAAVFQSIVNMKLLKRAADSAKKHLVLITTEAGLLPLAGAAGVHVAQTLTSKPEIPVGPDAVDDMEEMVEETGDEPEPEYTAENAGDRPVGELAGAAAAADDVETLELDDEPEASATAPAVAGAVAAKTPKDSRLKVPNFDRFRLWLIIGGLGLILFIFLLVLALSVLPKATIDISTDATNVNSNLNLKLSTAAKNLDTTDNTVPAKAAQQQKTYTQQATATGQKNTGNKASGNVTMTAQVCGSIPNQPPGDVPAGTGVSANGLTYITQQDTSFSSSGKPKGGCLYFNAESATPITAQNGGANYNTGGGTSFSVTQRSDVTASGSASGGTDNIVKVVSQSDIDSAKNKISTDDSTVKQALQDQLQHDGYYAIVATYNAGTPAVTNSANAGDATSSVTVTEVVTYTMFGVHQSDLKTLVDNDVKNQIDTSKQSILTEGLDHASFSVNSSTGIDAAVAMQTTATAGPQLDIAGIQRDAAGKKPGDIKSQLQANPDVTGVNVKLSPFWVNSVPKKTSKITVTIEKPTTTAGKNGASQ